MTNIFNNWIKDGSFFQFLSLGWDVDKAKDILINKEHKLESASVNSFAHLLSRVQNGMLTLGVYIDKDRLDSEEIDLSVPLIIVQDPKIKYMLIDGWHRIAKAQKLGVEELPCYLLTKTESKKVLIK